MKIKMGLMCLVAALSVLFAGYRERHDAACHRRADDDVAGYVKSLQEARQCSGEGRHRHDSRLGRDIRGFRGGQRSSFRSSTRGLEALGRTRDDESDAELRPGCRSSARCARSCRIASTKS